MGVLNKYPLKNLIGFFKELRPMSNDLTAPGTIPQIVGQGVMLLRETAIMSNILLRESNRSNEAKKKGETIDIPLPSAGTVEDVVPSANNPVTPDIGSDSVQLTLDTWKKSSFYMDDDDQEKVRDGFIPDTARNSLIKLVEWINADILTKVYKDVYNWTGTAGTTPFGSDTSAMSQARKYLQINKADQQNRHFVLDPEAEAQALELPLFQQVNMAGTNLAQVEGTITRKSGFNWAMDQSVATHTAGSITQVFSVNGAVDHTVTGGVSSVPVQTDASGACALVKGDIINFAGHSQNYSVFADLTLGASGSGTLQIVPQLQASLIDTEVITMAVNADHTCNLCFHSEFAAFASRPLKGGSNNPNMFSMRDEKTGFVIRLEVVRENKRDRWEWDMLYGVRTIRPELAVRVLG